VDSVEDVTIAFTLVSEMNDPASFGAERVILKGVQFTTLPLVNW